MLGILFIKRFKKYFLPFFGGVLGGLSISSYLWIILMPISLSILWGNLNNKYSNFLWGFAFIAISHYWLVYLHPLTWLGLSWISSILVAFLIWFMCSLLGGVLVFLWSFLGNNFFSKQNILNENILHLFTKVLFLSLIWAFGELILSKSPYFWIGISESLVPGDLYLAGIARWFGSSGLCVIQLFIGFWLFYIYQKWRSNLEFKNTLILGLLIISLLHLIGAILLIPIPNNYEYPIAVWQTNIPTREKAKLNYQKLYEKVISAQKNALDKDAKLLLMPEGTLPNGFMFKEGSQINTLAGGFRIYNKKLRSSLLAFNKGDKYFSNFLDKNRLVPLGEKVPEFLAAFPQSQLSAVGGVEPGESSRYFEWGNNPPLAIAICYEISNGNIIRKATKKGAELIISISNLDPYPEKIHHQFISLAIMRSIENKRDQLIVSNTGPSGLIRNNGNIESLLSPNIEEIKDLHPSFIDQNTFYSKFGDTPLIILFLLLFPTTLYVLLKN